MAEERTMNNVATTKKQRELDQARADLKIAMADIRTLIDTANQVERLQKLCREAADYVHSAQGPLLLEDTLRAAATP